MKNVLHIVRHPVSSLRWKWNAIQHSRRCYGCRHTFGHFHPFRDGLKACSPFILQLDVIGSDVKNFGCPYCDCHDRIRHLLMYFDRLHFWDKMKGASVLHFAPEGELSRRIEQCGPRVYCKADLHPAGPAVEKIDLMAIPFQNGTFDVAICNHVLEHVPDDAAALRELRRVLRPGGCAVLQTPYSRRLTHTFCDSGIDTDELRLWFYGQEDHVRLYGRDLFDRISETGLLISAHTHASLLADLDPMYYGVNRDEDLVLAFAPTQ